MPYVTTTAAAVREVRDAVNAIRGYPSLFDPIGPGPHVATDPNDPNSPGWTRQAHEIRQLGDDHSMWIDDADELAPRLTGLALAAVRSARDTLPPAWTDATPANPPVDPPGLSVAAPKGTP